MVDTEKRVENDLRKHGYKITPQRREVIKAVLESHEHLTPAAIHERVENEHPGIGLVTIYRTLEILIELGLICEMHAGGSCRSYIMRRPYEHHHHLICADCGAVIDFTDCDLGGLERRPFGKKSYYVQLFLRPVRCPGRDPFSGHRASS